MGLPYVESSPWFPSLQRSSVGSVFLGTLSSSKDAHGGERPPLSPTPIFWRMAHDQKSEVSGPPSFFGWFSRCCFLCFCLVGFSVGHRSTEFPPTNCRLRVGAGCPWASALKPASPSGADGLAGGWRGDGRGGAVWGVESRRRGGTPEIFVVEGTNPLRMGPFDPFGSFEGKPSRRFEAS